MRQNLDRNIAMTFRVSEEERGLIRKKMKQSGIINQRHFLLKMALEGRIIMIEMDSIREMNRLLGNIGNNVNQIARRVNQTGNVYENEIEELQSQFQKLGIQQGKILRLLTEVLEVVR